MRNAILTLLVIFLTATAVKAQLANPTHIGSVKGVLRDTAHNYTLKAATISLFKSDSTLMSYQLSNNYGEFAFRNLPLNSNMYLEISYIGYELYRKSFTIVDGKAPLDLKTLIVKTKNLQLKEVEIKIPPISMNGDTLEFNAAAFKLDSNAVVEDLLRKIPNVTLWGDGQITVNGREVKSLLVNGKEFFGNNFKIATQNIAKNALEKIQVYTTKDEKNPLDSTLTVNLKLKKGKDIGYFGKVGGGYGTSEKYEADGNLNMFSPKLQLGIVAASNNINKLANNAPALMAQSTFKGVGTNVEYQSDFKQSGINQPNVAGITFNYNFVEKPTWEKRSVLTGNYFIQNRNFENLYDAETTTSINTNTRIFDRNTNQVNSVFTDQKIDSRFDYTKNNHRLSVYQNGYLNSGNTENNTERSAINDQQVLTSTNNTIGQNNYVNKGISFGGNYDKSSNYLNRREHAFGGLQVWYDGSFHENQNDKSDLTTFRSFTNAADNRDFDRRYHTESYSTNQAIDVRLPNLKQWLFGYINLSGFDLTLSNRNSFSHNRDRNQIEDLNTSTNTYITNNYLSNLTEINYFDEKPGLTLSKGFFKSLANRFNRSYNFNISAKQLFIFQDIKSQKSFQNINRKYSRFVPDAAATYNFYQYGEYSRYINLSFNTNVRIPTLQQLAPLTDSTNLYYLQRGNPNLKEVVERVLNLNFNHYDQTSKNTLNYGVNFSGGLIENNIVDSIFIDNQNRRTIYMANANGHQFINGYGNIRKTLKFKTTELQIGFNGGINTTKTPSYVNDVFTFARTLNTNGRVNLFFTYKDKFATEAAQDFNTYSSKQEAFNTQYKGNNLASSLSSSYNITKKFTLASNITYNRSNSSGADPINFTIWNASAVYRFLKGNNAEFKFSALDLLRQNTNIVNYGNANSFTLGTQTVLQQYFMTTFSYYPRKFGKNQTKK